MRPSGKELAMMRRLYEDGRRNTGANANVDESFDSTISTDHTFRLPERHQDQREEEEVDSYKSFHSFGPRTYRQSCYC